MENLEKDDDILIEELSKQYNISNEEYIDILKYKKLEKQIDDNMENSINSISFMTGIREIDDMAKGLSAGVHILSGFRKCCKSTLAINFIYKALNDGMNVLFISLEMKEIDIINILLSMHSFMLNNKKAIKRNDIYNLYHNDKIAYMNLCKSFLSLPGSLIIIDEISCSDYNENYFDSIFSKYDEKAIEKNNKGINMVVIDNINVFKKWEKSSGELSYSMASDYFRRKALNFNYNNKPVIIFLLAQINRSGNYQVKQRGFYDESCIAETVNIERDATSIIQIYTDAELSADNIVRIKYVAGRYTRSQQEPVDVGAKLEYGIINLDIPIILGEHDYYKEIVKYNDYELIDVVDNRFDDYEYIPDSSIITIIHKKETPLPNGYKKYNSESIIEF